MKFPARLYVREEESDGSTFLLNYDNLADAVDGDGPTDIAEYGLVGIQKVEKETKIVVHVGKKRAARIRKRFKEAKKRAKNKGRKN